MPVESSFVGLCSIGPQTYPMRNWPKIIPVSGKNRILASAIVRVFSPTSRIRTVDTSRWCNQVSLSLLQLGPFPIRFTYRSSNMRTVHRSIWYGVDGTTVGTYLIAGVNGADLCSSLDIRLNSSLRRDPKQLKLVSESSHSEPWIYRCDFPKLMTIACLSGDIACDTIIAGSVCYYLQRSRTGFKRYVFHLSWCLRPNYKMRTERIRSSTYWSHMLSEPVCSQRRHFCKHW